MKFFSTAFIALSALALGSCTGHAVLDRPEIGWSLMHPTQLDTVYMERVIRESANHPVDNFEICGGCNSYTDGSLDGLLLFEEYPLARAAQHEDVVLHNQKSLKAIVRMAHEAGKPLYYWHREVLCNEGMIASVPELLDSRGEFDLLGKAYEDYLRYKLRKTFEIVPDLDGIVLTLTEASYSTIHNSRPDIYPSDKVVEKITRVFAEELESRGKRLILRSFGSIDADYKAIEAGARAIAKDHSFEIETKITPFDFSPFLPDNPYLKKIGGCRLCAECDALGEFYGAGRMSAEDIESIVRYVDYARKCGVDRMALRLDRHGRNVFDVCPANLYAYEQALSHPEKTAAQIRKDFYESTYPAKVAAELIKISEDGIKSAHRTLFADGSVIFHQFPTKAVMKFIKSGGFLATFAPEGKLSMKKEQWGMLSERKVPGRAFLLDEKQQAVDYADDALRRLESISGELPASEHERIKALLDYNYAEALSIREYFRVIAAYFDSMEASDSQGRALSAAFDELKRNLSRIRCGRPIEELAALFVQEYPLEFKMREDLSDAVDFVIPGGTIDQIRIEQYMHGANPVINDGRLGLVAGNGVFPNGYVRTVLRGDGKACLLRLSGIGECKVIVNDNPYIVDLDAAKDIVLPASSEYDVLVCKTDGKEYPVIESIALFLQPSLL